MVLETDAGEQRFEVDDLLMATGRKPAVKGLGLEAAGVGYNERMGIHVDNRPRTSNPDVFAVGDVASKYQFMHMADFMARMVIRNALFFGRDRFSNFLIPWATYTEPESAHVGLYERDLQAQDIAYNTYTWEFADVDRTIVDFRSPDVASPIIYVASGKGWRRLRIKRMSSQRSRSDSVSSKLGIAEPAMP